MPRKTTVAVQHLSHCGGCEEALLALGGHLLDLLDERIDLVYAPLFMGAKDYGEVDLILLTGAARSDEDLRHLWKARERARYVAAFGSCATFGGIPGLANMADQEELLNRAFAAVPSIEPAEAAEPIRDIPALTQEVKPVTAYIDVHYSLVGCPPLPPMVARFLDHILHRIAREEGRRLDTAH